MFQAKTIEASNKPELYRQLCQQAKALVHGEYNHIANAANLAALIYHGLPDVNWAGFYFYDGTELVVGPFQGQPACLRIPLGKGVCGTAAAERRSLVVDDVNEFPGHIACDVASASEVVVPLYQNEQLIGVLDIDSPSPNRFDDEDRKGLEAIAALYLAQLEAPAP